MPLWTNPPHRVTSYTVASARESSGAGTQLTYSSAQSAIPCSINTASAQTQELYAQDNIKVSHTIAFLTSALTTVLSRGMKLVADDTSLAFHIRGLRAGRAYGGVPAFTYADCEQIL